VLLDILRWTATATGIVAAVLVALNAGPRVTGIGFIIFTVCSVSWTTVGLLDGETGLGIQNLVLTAVNLLGIYRYLIAKPPRIGSFKGLEKAD
jgi:hypothetical protein